MRAKASQQRGVALLVVLWGCTLAAITLGALAANARVEGMQARAQSQRTIALYAAQAGIDEAVFRLRVADASARWVPDGRVYRTRIGAADVSIQVIDEDGKINLNSATPELIERLLVATGIDDERIHRANAAIVAWGSKRPAGASSLLERGGFASLEELQRVPGLDADVAARIEPALTLWNAGVPNLAHAPPLVVSAVTGADAGSAEAFVGEVRSVLPGNTILPAVPGNLPGSMSAGSSGSYSLVAEARLSGGVSVALYVTLIAHSEPGDPRAYRVLRWRERSFASNT